MMPSSFKTDQYVKDPISSSSSSSRSSSSSPYRSSHFSHSPAIICPTGYIINHISDPNLFTSEQYYDVHQHSYHGYNTVCRSPTYSRAEPTYTRSVAPPASHPLPMASKYALSLPPTPLAVDSAQISPSPTIPGLYEYVLSKATPLSHHGRTSTDIEFVKRLQVTRSGLKSGPATSTSGRPFLPTTGSNDALANPGDDDSKFKSLKDDLSKLGSIIEHREQTERHAKIRTEAVEGGDEKIIFHRQNWRHSALPSTVLHFDTYGFLSPSMSHYSARGRMVKHELIISLPFPPSPPYPPSQPRNPTSHYLSHGGPGLIVADDGPVSGISLHPSPRDPHSRSCSYTGIREIHNLHDDEDGGVMYMFGYELEEIIRV